MHQTKALGVLEHVEEENEPLAQCLKLIGDILSKDRETYEEALRTYQRALTIREKIHPPNHPHAATSHMDVGGVYGRLGRFDFALKHLEQCLQIQENSLPLDHPEIGVTYTYMGLVYLCKKDLLRATALPEKALNIYRQSSLPPEHPNIVHTLAVVDTINRLQS